ncbi:MAG TPA: outer spore coat protein CotE [Bacillota bacterium]|nr:outer spore coat protein CotE [Bacillota bacterium]
MSFLDKDYREIITKAVIGKGRKYTKENHFIKPPHQPSSILGCWVINHLYNAKMKSKKSVQIQGSYDINVWYSYNDNTKTEVVTERVSYKDTVPLSVRDKHTTSERYDVIAKVIQQPNCLTCKIDKKTKKIDVKIEREFVVQVIGNTKLYVKVDPNWHHTKEDDFDWSYKATDDELSDVQTDFFPKSDEHH